MLLQRLSEYADTLGLPPPMYQNVPIRYIIRLDRDGRQPQVIDCASAENKRGKSMPAPDCVRSSADRPILLADHAEYTLGIPRKGKSSEDAGRRHRPYVELIADCAVATRELTVVAVMRFLSELESGTLELPVDFDASERITFEVEGVRPIDLPSVRAYWAGKAAAGDITQPMQCLVCGETRPPVARLPIQIKGIPGGQQTGMALISANASAFESYGLKESRIAPTCEECGQRFGNALNTLLRQSETHLVIPPVAYIFWTREPTQFSFGSMLARTNATEVQQFLTSLWRGKQAYLDTTPFYAAAFSASNARIIVRDWLETTLGEAQRHLGRYFMLQRIIDGSGEPRWFSLWRLANATINTEGKEKPAPHVAQALLRMAFYGGPLPRWLLYQVVRRTRAEQNVQAAHAALIKMVFLSRDTSASADTTLVGDTPINIERGTGLAELDLSSNDAAYLCGRLLAVLESIQRTALGGDVNATIVDRYYSTASSAPASVFARLLRGAQPHLSVLRRDETRKGAFFRLDGQLQEILAGFGEKQFPSTLDLMAQGRFALGYYHQKVADKRAAYAAASKKNAQQLDVTPSEIDDLDRTRYEAIVGEDRSE
jgi:CRISPR-associated protein Csd1